MAEAEGNLRPTPNGTHDDAPSDLPPLMWDMYYGPGSQPDNPHLYSDYERAERGVYLFRLYEYEQKRPAFRLEILHSGEQVLQEKYNDIDAAKDRAEKFVADNCVWL